MSNLWISYRIKLQWCGVESTILGLKEKRRNHKKNYIHNASYNFFFLFFLLARKRIHSFYIKVLLSKWELNGDGHFCFDEWEMKSKRMKALLFEKFDWSFFFTEVNIFFFCKWYFFFLNDISSRKWHYDVIDRDNVYTVGLNLLIYLFTYLFNYLSITIKVRYFYVF